MEKPKDRWWWTIIKGMIWGMAGAVPGLSAGVIAIVLGFYRNLIAVSAHPFREIRRQWKFLFLLVSGAIVGLAVFLGLMTRILSSDAISYLIYVFLGMALGSIPGLIKTANLYGFKKQYLIPFGVTLGVFLAVDIASAIAQKNGWSLALPLDLMTSFWSGSIIALGCIIPGLTSGFILIFLGLYDQLIAAFHSVDWGVILITLSSFGVVFVVGSQVMNWLFKTYYGGTYYAVMGIAIGSVVLAFPRDSGWKLALGFVLLGLGILISFGLSKQERHQVPIGKGKTKANIK